MSGENFKSYFYMSIGWLSFALGILGIFLPLLPTTPFMILAAACFSKGSPRFHTWILNHPLFGPPILDWRRNRAIRPRYKIIAGIMMSGSCVMIFMMEAIPLAGKISFLIFMAAMMLFVFTRRNA
ncbi:MAG: YbaN family protein [Bdellovibrionales bacterium]|nr:YbaN family protein [Bdellovibrionales bacterium]